jgi:nicotinamide-nucleotide amidase
MTFSQQLNEVVSKVADLLTQQQLSLATAESCTGGWVAKACTDFAGSSAWFDRGFVTYSNQAKSDMLGVSMTTLSNHGAVSPQTAVEMAEGAVAFSEADLSVAITGIAGPSGGTELKPVGTVCFAWSDRLLGTRQQQHKLSGDREHIRQQAVIIALEGIIKNARDRATSVG